MTIAQFLKVHESLTNQLLEGQISKEDHQKEVGLLLRGLIHSAFEAARNGIFKKQN